MAAGTIHGVPESSPQPRSTQGLLAIWHGVAPGFEPSFDEWYDRQHHLERVSIPGFHRARRYVAVGNGPRYFARYDVADERVLASEAYLAALNNPTAWTRTLMPRYRATTRSVFRYKQGLGDADGAELFTLRLPAHDVPDVPIPPAVLEPLTAAPGVLRVEVWDADVAVSSLRSEEKKLRGTADQVVGRAILVEGSSSHRVADAIARHLLPALSDPVTMDHYRLAFDLVRH